MTVKQLVLSAAELLRLDDAMQILGSDAEPDDDVNALVKAANIAAAELGADGYPLLKTQTLYARDKVIALDAFEKRPAYVREVTRSGARIRFSVDSDGVHVPRDGRYTVVYSVLPGECGLDDALKISGLCDPMTAAFLTARDYCLMTGMNAEAGLWDQLYTTAAEKYRIRRRPYLPARSWH